MDLAKVKAIKDMPTKKSRNKFEASKEGLII